MINLTEEMLNLSYQLMLTKDKAEILRVSARLNSLAAECIPKNTLQPEGTTAIVLHLTQKEIAKMPKKFRKEFIAEGCVCHGYKRPSGKKSYCYELCYRRNGYNVTASSTDPAVAKQKFIEKLCEALQKEIMPKKSQTFFNEIAYEWLSVREGNLHPKTFKNYKSYYERYILSDLKNRDIRKISTADLNRIVTKVKEKGRAYEDVRSILNQIFNYAVCNGIINYNPVQLVEFKKADRKNGIALTEKQEKYLIDRLNTPEATGSRQGFLAMLFFGLRPSEVETAYVDGEFLIARNHKRKKGKIEYKKIPISPMARKYLDLDKPFNFPVDLSHLARYFKKQFPKLDALKPYDLRHTFSTRCQQFVRQEIVAIWMGDSPERLVGRTYTHFSDEFMISEMNKVNYII